MLSRLGSAIWLFASWTVRSWRAILVCLVIGNLLVIADHEAAGVAVQWLVPAWSLVRAVWNTASPLTYEVVLGGRLRRRAWRRRVRKEWARVAQRCGLASPREKDERQTIARLSGIQTSGNILTLRVRAAVGQTVDDLDRAVEAIATAFGAQSAECRRVGPGMVEMNLTMRELLHEPTTPPVPHDLETEAVDLGRRSDGSPWRLELNGRHTLVVGRSGAGKGSIFWGIAGNLAPAAHAGLVRLWGIDLKGGVEVAVGAGMFSAVAMDEHSALRLLKSLHQVIVERQAVMRGRSRLFEPSPGDPSHVLLIDELAVLTAYASRDVVNEASTLLKRILTQGRALGVMVVAFVQDPRKETVGMRELFTQTIALRLASSSETRMVLGDGYGDLAPAHRIDRTMPGAGYVVRDDGAVERVRADFWPDDVIRMVAEIYPAPVPSVDVDEDRPVSEPLFVAPPDADAPPAPRRRTPRTPRKPKDSEVA
ncbi:FtsK/SpoIIIE domain-containing protein [Cellulomonas sp. Leaf334]|uniref:FtsK/SpoIIIE domain-containing protein n=1 Tax=Cellulomonas sp. Leaf334 TaxID=1736339 RepID=UPI001910CF36|nr:FtsK/SpoIIIE domain-containing protein [Cellulomonas sp. Leaf334]